MQGDFGPVYEVTHHIDSEIIGDFDAWLAQHVEEMLALPGITGASVYAADDDDQGRARRVTIYRFESDKDLELYLAGPAETMRQSAGELFSGRFEVSRRILHETEVVTVRFAPQMFASIAAHL